MGARAEEEREERAKGLGATAEEERDERAKGVGATAEEEREERESSDCAKEEENDATDSGRAAAVLSGTWEAAELRSAEAEVAERGESSRAPGAVSCAAMTERANVEAGPRASGADEKRGKLVESCSG